MKSTLVVKNKFVMFALDRVKLSTVHRKKSCEGKGRKIKEKTPRDLGPAYTTIHTREDGPTVQRCGDSDVTCGWINGQCSLEQEYRGRTGQVQKKPYIRGGKGRLPIQFRRLIRETRLPGEQSGSRPLGHYGG